MFTFFLDLVKVTPFDVVKDPKIVPYVTQLLLC